MSNPTVVGFPRTGNVFLTTAFKLMYGNTSSIPKHTTRALETYNRVVVPMREPLETLRSYTQRRIGNYTLDDHINFYVRFHNKVQDNLSKLLLVSFDVFTSNLDYINVQVKEKFNVSAQTIPSVKEVKQLIIADGWTKNLPGNIPSSDEVRQRVLEHPRYGECVNLYNALQRYVA